MKMLPSPCFRENSTISRESCGQIHCYATALIISNLGAFHGIEYPYLFDFFLTGKFEFDENDKKVQKLFIDSIANFVKNG
jgi:hypothetical protein